MSKLNCALLLLLFISFPTLASKNPVDGSKLFTNPSFSNLRISPDGKIVSAVFRNDKHHNISLIDLKSNSIAMTINLGIDSRLLGYYWLNNSQLMLVGKYETTTANLIATIVDGKVDVKLAKAKGYLVDVMSDKPQEILFARKNHGQGNTLYTVKIPNLIEDNFDDAVEVEHNDSDVSYYFHDNLSDKLITRDYDSKDKILTIKAIPRSGGSWKIILSRKIDDVEFTVAAILDSNYLAVLTNELTDKVALYKYNIKKQQLEDVIYQHAKYDLKSAGFQEDGSLFWVMYEEHGLSKKEYFNSVSKEIDTRLSNTFNRMEYYLVDTDKNKAKSIIKVQGADLPGEYLVYDREQSKLVRLLLSHLELENRKLHKSKVLMTQTKDGVEIEAFLTIPDPKDSLNTLLVMPHGGPVGVKDDDRFNPFVQYFATRGFSILRVNFRGSDGFGKDFQQEGVGEFGKLIEQDITTVVNRVLRENNYKNVCSVGASYGGYSAVMLAIKHPKTYQCVVGRFGVYDLPLLFNHDNHISQEKNRSKIENVVGKFSPELTKLSPVYFADQLKAPILLTAGVEDETAVFEHTFRMAYILKKISHTVETMYYEDTAHGHSLWSGDRHEAAIIYDFLIRTLGLNYPSSKQLNTKARIALAEDFSLIADKYNFDDSVENDEVKAFQFYKKAAEYGEPRSNFNMGAHYHRGDQVDVDLKKAVDYYQKAADLNYDSAHRRLGRMYMEGEYLENNWGKAKEHLEKALNLDDTAKNYLTLARFDCTAPEEFRNIRRCLNILNLERFKKRSKATYKQALRSLRTVAPWIIAETKFSSSEREEFEKVLNTALKLNEMEVGIESFRAGSFEYVEGIGYGNEDKYVDLSTGEIVNFSNDDDHYFGVIFDVDVPGIDRSYDQVGVAARWTKNMKNGSNNYLSATVLYGSPKAEWKLLKGFDEFNGAESVTVELFDLRGTPLLNKTFKLAESN